MELKPILTEEERDALPEALYKRYEPHEGKYRLNMPGVHLSDEVQGLQDALRSEREKREAAEKLTSKLSAQLKGIEVDQAAQEQGITRDKLDAIRQDVREEIEAEYGPKLEAAESALEENRRLKLDNRVKDLAAKNGVRGERLDAWWRQHQDKFDLTDDGEPVVKDHPGKKVTHFITNDLKKEIPEFYEGTKADGGGAPGSGGAGTGGSSALSFEDVLKNPSRGIEEANKATTAVGQ